MFLRWKNKRKSHPEHLGWNFFLKAGSILGKDEAF